MFIYLVTNKINGKQYVGLTKKRINQRISEHISAGTYIGKALRKYGLKCFSISLIDSAVTIGILYEKERYWIRFYNCKHPNGYNLTEGGDGKLGFKPTDETKKLWSEIRKGKIPWNKGLTKEIDSRVKRGNLTQEHRNKIRQALLGHKVSEKTKAKVSKTKKDQHLKITFTQEHKDKISKSRMGIKFTEEHKMNLKKAHLMRKISNGQIGISDNTIKEL